MIAKFLILFPTPTIIRFTAAYEPQCTEKKPWKHSQGDIKQYSQNHIYYYCYYYYYDLCNKINYSRHLIFADDIKIFRVIKSPDCNRLQSDIDSVQGWCTANFMKLNIS
jgi:hypothetical protein